MDKINDVYYKFIFENSLDAIMLTSPDGKVYKANAAACSMFGRSEKELITLGREGVVDTKDPRLAKALKERALNGYIKTELNFKRKDGTVFPVLLTSKIFKDDYGNEWTAMIVRDITNTKEMESKLKKMRDDADYLATHDYLTEVHNRRGFLENLVTKLKLKDKNFCLAMLDIDNFKTVNDRYGHLKGDIILKEFSKRLKAYISKKDIIGRYGGDEFIIYFDMCDETDAEIIAENIRDNIENSEINIESQSIKVTVSIGVVCTNSSVVKNIDALISEVDNNMYKAKDKRNDLYISCKLE